MRILARERPAPVRRVLGALLLLPALACGPELGPALPVVDRFALPSDSLSTLFVDSLGRTWLGGPEGLRVLEGGREVRRVPVEGEGAPRVLGAMGGRLLVRTGERVLALDPRGAEPRAERGEVRGRVLRDVRGRFLLVASPSGEVRGLDPRSLEPLWVWPSLGETSAAALSPEGDRVYLAVSRDEGAAALLSRDLQTGRALRGEDLSADVEWLEAGPRGELFALVDARGGGEGSVVALAPGGAGLASLWRRSLRSLRLEGEVEARLAPGGTRLVLFAPGNDAGLRVLDAETGEPRGSVRGPVRDAAFAADGASLYLLTGSEVRVVRAP